MKCQKDYQLLADNNSIFDFAAFTTIGDRESQQDCIGGSFMSGDGIVIVCDGMGGHEGGKLASSVAVDTVLYAFDDSYPCADTPGMLLSATRAANQRVTGLTDESGAVLHAGSTIATVVVRNMNLFWNSVGDSRVYLHRAGEFVQITQDQNYRTVLDERLRAGEISVNEYNMEIVRGEALISYLGIGNLQLIDYNTSPFPLRRGDKILLMSDGLYKVVSDEEMGRIIDNFSNISEALQALELKAQKNAKKYAISRDNMTAALIKIK